MPFPDVVAAIVQLLRQDAEVTALAGQRVYGVRLPASESQHMPRGAVVVSRGGGGIGLGNRSYVQIENSRIDVRCYGLTDYEAKQLDAAAHAVLKGWRGGPVGDCFLYPARIEIGPVDLLEPEVEWPLVWQSYQVMASETPVTV